MAAAEGEALMMITSNGKLIRTAVDSVNSIGRNTQGVRLINLDENDSLVAATTFVPEDEEDACETEDDQLRQESSTESTESDASTTDSTEA
jgi:DNA gyrase subunit A